MTTKYCSIKNVTAAVTAGGVSYTTDKPPIWVSRNCLVLEYGTNFEKVGVIGEYDMTTVQLSYVSKVDASPFHIEFYVTQIADNQALASYGMDYTDGEHAPTGRLTNYGLVALDNSGDIILTSKMDQPYTVKCDGCPPGDCKGKKAAYPGYVCLDCKDAEARLNRIKAKAVQYKGMIKNG